MEATADADADAADAVLRAIAEPHRREILRLARAQEMSAGEIASHFELTRPAVSQHLRVLREAGLLGERREGARRLYRARPEAIGELREYLDGFWGEGLERLRFHAEAEQQRKARGADAN